MGDTEVYMFCETQRYIGANPCQLQLVSESEKAQNVSTNEVEPDFKKGTELQNPQKKIKLVAT